MSANLTRAILNAYNTLIKAGYADLARGVVGKDYNAIRDGYANDIYGAVEDYLKGDQAITKFRNTFRKSILTYFDAAFFTGYLDAGGAVNEMTDEDKAWLIARQEQEIGFADALFQQLKSIRTEARDTGESPFEIAMKRSQGYTKTLDGVYAQGKMRGSSNVMLTLQGPDGKESCTTCQKLKGKRHSAKWWRDRDLIPYQGNANYECGCWICQHRLFTDDGKQYAP